MGLFSKKSKVDIPDESTADRAALKQDALRSLRRAKELKKRSAVIAADLNEEGVTNHYIERLREAWGVTS